MPKCVGVLEALGGGAVTAVASGHTFVSGIVAKHHQQLVETECAMKKRVVVLGLVGLVAATIAVGTWMSVVAGARRAVDDLRAVQDAQFRSVEAKIVADEALLAKTPLLSTTIDGPDAGPLLLQHVRFGATPTKAPVSAALAERLNTNWLAQVDDEEVARLDLSWMAQLPSAGFWDLEGAGSPLEHAPFAVFTESLPQFVDVKHLAMVRLLQGLKAHTTPSAAAEVRALARLALSTESMIGEMIGVNLLTLEQRAHAQATSAGDDTTGWTPPTTAEIDALKRVLFAALSQHSLTSSTTATAHRFPIGTCAALREGLGGALYFSAFARDEYAERYVELGDALRASPCRLRRLRLAWANPTPSTAAMLNTVCVDEELRPRGDCAVPDAALGLPGVRGFLTNTLLVIAQPGTLTGYLKPAAPGSTLPPPR